MDQFLLIHIIGGLDNTKVSDITETIFQHQCQINKCRFTICGDHWSFIVQINGKWNNVNKLETALNNQCQQKNMTLLCKRCHEIKTEGELLPYTIELISPAADNLLNELCKFLEDSGLYITEIYTQTNSRNFTQTPISTVVIKIYIPADTQLNSLREQFMLLCDDLNIDAILEPERR